MSFKITLNPTKYRYHYFSRVGRLKSERQTEIRIWYNSTFGTSVIQQFFTFDNPIHVKTYES